MGRIGRFKLLGKDNMKSYGEIQSETILNGGTIEDAEKIYQEQLKKGV